MRHIIAKRIKYFREKKELTQSQLAALIEKERQYIWRLENGLVNITVDYLDKIVTKLECKDEFFREQAGL